MNNLSLAQEFKKHLEIMENTFTANNLQVVNVGCQPYDDEDADFRLYVELVSISGSSIPCTLGVKVNLYDEENSLYLTECTHLWQNKFSGYDTITISCEDNSRALQTAVKGRLYVVRC